MIWNPLLWWQCPDEVEESEIDISRRQPPSKASVHRDVLICGTPIYVVRRISGEIIGVYLSQNVAQLVTERINRR
jgi:hypothetical protein